MTAIKLIDENTGDFVTLDIDEETKYLFRAQNRAGLAKVISVSLEFYEI